MRTRITQIANEMNPPPIAATVEVGMLAVGKTLGSALGYGWTLVGVMLAWSKTDVGGNGDLNIPVLLRDEI